MTFLFEANLAVVALVIGWVVDILPHQHLLLSSEALSIGIMGTLPLYLLFHALYQNPIGGFKQIKQSLLEVMGVHLCRLSWFHLAALAAVAGFAEELLFRGTIQPWLENKGGYLFGLLASNVIFGLVHAVTRLYAILAGLVGIYLGYLLDVGSERNLLAPMITHGFYDFIAFIVIANSARAQQL